MNSRGNHLFRLTLISMFDKEELIFLKKNRRRDLTGKGTSTDSDESLIIKPFVTTMQIDVEVVTFIPNFCCYVPRR